MFRYGSDWFLCIHWSFIWNHVGPGVALAYSKVSIPEPLMKRIQRLVEAHPEWGYRSASDVVTDLARQWADARDRHPEKG